MTGAGGIDLLRDPRALTAADAAGLLPAAGCAGAQVRAVAGQQSFFRRVDRPRALVVIGPTAVTDVALLTALIGSQSPTPVLAAAVLPAWVGPLDLVVVLAARRDDEACARGAAEARRRGAIVHVRGAVDGPVALAAEADLRPVEVAVPEALAAPARLAVLAAAATSAGLLPDQGLERVADLLDVLALAMHPHAASFTNPAVNLAEYLLGSTPVLVGADPLADAVAGHGVDALAELAGIAATVIASGRALMSPMLLSRIGAESDLFADPFESGEEVPLTRAVLLSDEGSDGDDRARRGALQRALPRAPLVEPVVESGDPATPLGRALACLIQLDMAAVYLGVAYGQRRPPDHPEGLGRSGGALWAVRAPTVETGSAARRPGDDEDRDDRGPDDSGRMTDLWT